MSVEPLIKPDEIGLVDTRVRGNGEKPVAQELGPFSGSFTREE
jgi:hypothetical protein